MEKQYQKLVDQSNEEKENHKKTIEKNKELQEKADELESQIRDSQSQISQLQTEANTQNFAVESARALAEKSSSEHSMLKEEYSNLQRKYENDINHYKQQLEETQKKLQIMTNTIEENYQILDKIKRQRHILGKQIERLQSANNMLQETIDYQNRRLKRENADSIADLQVKLSTAQKELAQQSLLYDELNNKCKQLQSDNAAQIAARKTAEFKYKAMEERMEIEKKSYESRVSATANAAETAKENIQIEANKQIKEALSRLSRLLTPATGQPTTLDEAITFIERDLNNLRNAQAAYVSTIDSVIRAQKLLKVRSPNEIAGAVELLLDKLAGNSLIDRSNIPLSNTAYNDYKQEIDRLKRQIRVNDSVAAQLKQWETWARRLNNIIHEGESLKSRESNDIRLSLEECILASISHRAVFNRVDSLRAQKRILLSYDRRLLSNFNNKTTLRNLIIVSVSYKLMGETFYFGNTTMLTIKTGSMETANDANTYLDENNLTNQIEQYSIITLNKVKSDDELNLYDIAAYEHDNTIYVHRIIRKYTNLTTGVTYYTFRGDANSESLSFELTITLDDIVGKYTGFQNYGLGVTLTYLQSTIGIVAMAAALIFLITYNVTEDRIETNYYKRILLISQELDKKLGFVTSEVK